MELDNVYMQSIAEHPKALLKMLTKIACKETHRIPNDLSKASVLGLFPAWLFT